LLSFELNGGRFGCYAPPLVQPAWRERFAFMEKAGARWWPILDEGCGVGGRAHAATISARARQRGAPPPNGPHARLRRSGYAAEQRPGTNHMTVINRRNARSAMPVTRSHTRLRLGVVAALLAACATAGGDAARHEPLPVFEGGPTPHTRNATDADPRTATLADLEFLVGRWVGEAFGGTVEETWNPIIGGEMLGTFRLVQEGAPVFYEIMVLSSEEGRIVLRLKHFDPGLIGWEEKADSVAFPLIEVRGTTAWFNGLTLHRTGDVLVGYLALHRGDEVNEEEFQFRLAPH
jgi:hypothetical protein